MFCPLLRSILTSIFATNAYTTCMLSARLNVRPTALVALFADNAARRSSSNISPPFSCKTASAAAKSTPLSDPSLMQRWATARRSAARAADVVEDC